MKRYTVQINGITTTQRLSDADAAARGLTEADLVVTKAKTPANKSRKPANKRAQGSFGPRGAE